MTSLKISSTNTTSGFSLIEVVLVLALISLVAAIGPTFSFQTISRSYALSERDLLVSLLTKQRAQALANVHEAPQGLYIDSTSYVLFEGSSYSANNPTNQAVPKLSRATITGAQSMVFQQLTADVATPGTITITGDAQTYTIAVNAAGRLDW